MFGILATMTEGKKEFLSNSPISPHPVGSSVSQEFQLFEYTACDSAHIYSILP